MKRGTSNEPDDKYIKDLYKQSGLGSSLPQNPHHNQ